MREYLYRTTVGGLTHDEYLDEPDHVVDWVLGIKRTYDKHEEPR